MLQRLKIAIPLILLFVLCFILPPPYATFYFGAFAVLALLLGAGELYAMLLPGDAVRPFARCTKLFAALTAVAQLLLIRLGHSTDGILMPAMTACYLLVIFCVLFAGDLTRDRLNALFLSLGIFFYITCTLIYALKLFCLERVNGPLMLLALVLITKMGDVGAYVTGTLSARMMQGGNHKLSKVISPKKSWEGLAGGIFFSVLTALVIHCCFPSMLSPRLLSGIGTPRPVLSLPQFLAWGVCAAVIGLIGDLAESSVKRVAGVKDSGNLPGIGGVLDVLDSLVLMVPLFYAHVMMNMPTL